MESFQRLREDDYLAKLKDDDERRRKKVEALASGSGERALFMIFLQNPEDKSFFISGNFLFFYSLFTFVMCNSFGYILLGMKVSWYLLRTVICETEILLNCWRLGSWLVVSSVKS